MTANEIFDRNGTILATVVFVLSFLLFFSDTSSFWGSIGAAAISAGLVWITYVIIRWMFLAAK